MWEKAIGHTLRVISEQEDGDLLTEQYWHADFDALRQAMTDIQEQAKASVPSRA